MLAAARDRTRQRRAALEQAWPETGGPQILALAGRDPDTGTVSLILDAQRDHRVPCQNLHMGAEVVFLAVISLLCGTR
jgi:hypothetical protein